MKKSARAKKHEIRRRVLALRNLYGSKLLSRLVCENLLQFIESQFFHLKSLGCYNAIGSEVDLKALFPELVFRGYTLSTPIVEKDSMFFENKIQIALIPLVAFDLEKNRLGYGGGYYDRFLEGKSIVRVGVAYSFQYFPHIPVIQHDQRMDCIITEAGIHN